MQPGPREPRLFCRSRCNMRHTRKTTTSTSEVWTYCLRRPSKQSRWSSRLNFRGVFWVGQLGDHHESEFLVVRHGVVAQPDHVLPPLLEFLLEQYWLQSRVQFLQGTRTGMFMVIWAYSSMALHRTPSRVFACKYSSYYVRAYIRAIRGRVQRSKALDHLTIGEKTIAYTRY